MPHNEVQVAQTKCGKVSIIVRTCPYHEIFENNVHPWQYTYYRTVRDLFSKYMHVKCMQK